MAEEEKSEEVKKITVDTAPHLDGADGNGDGHISQQELEMHLEYKKKELDDQDAMRDAQRNMAWFALSGMLLYPSLVVLAYLINLDTAGKVLGDMAATYFVSVAAIVAAFYGKEALIKKSK